jgi:uncharacterized integral membrane protein
MKKKNESKTSIQDSLVEMDFTRLSKFQIFKLILSGITLVIAIIALIQNLHSVSLKFLFWNIYLSVSLLILISIVFGFIIAYIREERKIHKKNKEIKILKQKIIELNKK